MKDNSAFSGERSKARSLGRDWLLLPLVSLLTVGVILGPTEWLARTETTAHSNCELTGDGSFGLRFVPNSTCVEKIPETPPVRYEVNSCGDRAGMACGRKPADTYRIVVIGSSFAFGSRVPWEETFSARLPRQLTSETGHAVQVYNEGILEWGTPRVVATRMKEVLAEQPDLILMVLSSWDIENASVLVFEQPLKDRNPSISTIIKTEPLPKLPIRIVEALGKQSKAVFWLRHLLLGSQSQLVAATLHKQGSAGFLKSDFDAAWRDHLHEFDAQFARIASSAAASKVPISVVYIPDHAQAAMVWMGTWPNGYDPYKLDHELNSIVRSHGGTYLDILPGFQRFPNPGSSYLPIDGHPDGNAHEVISELLAGALTEGQIPALKASRNTQGGAGNQQ